MQTVREVTFDLLRDLGLTTVFGNPGSTEMPFLADFPADFRYILGLHEGAVVAMADGYAQSTRRPTLVNLHTAAGVGNAMGSIINARGAHSPLVVTAGQQVRAMLTLQPMLANPAPVALPTPVVKWAFEPPRPQDVPAALARAAQLAALPPQGPVFVSLPMDDFDAPVEAADAEKPRDLATRTITGRAAPHPAIVTELAERLANARNPALVIGADADTPEAFAHAVALADKCRLPVWLAPNAPRCGFPTNHPYFQGPLPTGIGWVSDTLTGHDLILVAGAPIFRYYPYVPGRYLPPGATLVAITCDPEEAARAPVGDAILADVALALGQLVAAVPATDRPAPKKPEATPIADNGGSVLTAADVHVCLGEALPDEGIIVSESMNDIDVFWQRVPLTRPGSFFFCGAGGLGYGLGGGVGIQLAQPDRPVVVITGDGGAQYSISALWTAAHYGLPVTFIVFKNDEYGILKGFGDFLGKAGVPGLDITGLDYQHLARGYGVPATRPTTTAELGDAVRKAIASDTPEVIEVPIKQGVTLG